MNKKIKLQEKLLNQLSHTPMNRQQMADYLGVTVIFIARYITELRANKKIHISYYERTQNGKPKSFYATGNKPDAKELAPIPQRELQRKYRAMAHGNANHKKFVPHMDISASWMLNPC
jgi:predicted ArsR family transcriptional regulator